MFSFEIRRGRLLHQRCVDHRLAQEVWHCGDSLPLQETLWRTGVLRGAGSYHWKPGCHGNTHCFLAHRAESEMRQKLLFEFLQSSDMIEQHRAQHSRSSHLSRSQLYSPRCSLSVCCWIQPTIISGVSFLRKYQNSWARRFKEETNQRHESCWEQVTVWPNICPREATFLRTLWNRHCLRPSSLVGGLPPRLCWHIATCNLHQLSVEKHETTGSSHLTTSDSGGLC